MRAASRCRVCRPARFANETGKEGCAFFRRPDSTILMSDVTLHNIEPDTDYQVSISGETCAGAAAVVEQAAFAAAAILADTRP